MPRGCARCRNACGWTVPFFDSARALSLDRLGRDPANSSTRSYLGRTVKRQFAYSDLSSEWKPRTRNGNASSRLASTGSRKCSLLGSMLPVNWYCVVSSTTSMEWRLLTLSRSPGCTESARTQPGRHSARGSGAHRISRVFLRGNGRAARPGNSPSLTQHRIGRASWATTGPWCVPGSGTAGSGAPPARCNKPPCHAPPPSPDSLQAHLSLQLTCGDELWYGN